ncbi:MAG: 3-phosphoglycerate dehydrogenase, partial [Synergistaceae bacterium]|nr:3-phosphoglycerate dehydrogenase [Synergistaceae bacterium]
NFPEVNAGLCGAEARVAILHRNIPAMLSGITSFFGDNGLNIENLINRARGQYAYTLVDISHKMPDDTTDRLREINGVLRVRRVKERS